MGNCRDCKHWDQKSLDGDYLTSANLGICGLTYFENLPHVEDADGFDRLAFPPQRLAMAQDGSDYKAHLITREDFGCVQFSQK